VTDLFVNTIRAVIFKCSFGKRNSGIKDFADQRQKFFFKSGRDRDEFNGLVAIFLAPQTNIVVFFKQTP
jgi:hypothetical protein